MKKRNELEEFLNDHMGMFVHWGLYSILAGEWQDQKLAPDQLGEWIMLHLSIPLRDYSQLTESFRPIPDCAEKWVVAAKQAGIRYMVLTTMHHDGFCLFRTEVNDFNAYDQIGRDLVGELAQACRRHGIRLGFYYSHTLDWSHPDALGTRTTGGRKVQDGNWWDFPDESVKDYSRFLYGKVFPQVRELLTQYGDVALMWFDYPHNITPAQSRELYDLVKSIQPRCLVNSRIGNIEPDFYDLGDNQIPTLPMNVPQECLVTLNDTWGYKKCDSHWKSPEQMIDKIARSASCAANLLINVGPMGDGRLTDETFGIMEGIGRWMAINGDTIYGSRGNPFKAVFDWGYVSAGDDAIYLYLMDSSARTVVINGLISDVESVEVVGDGRQASYEQTDMPQGYRSLTIALPASPLRMPVYRVRCRGGVRTDNRILQQDDSLSLYPLWARKYRKGPSADTAADMQIEHSVYNPENGKHDLALNRIGIASGWMSGDEYLQWEALFTSPGTYDIRLVSMPGRHIGDIGCGVTIDVGERDRPRRAVTADVLSETSQRSLSLTGQDNRRIESACGTLRIDRAGSRTVRLYRNQSTAVPLPFVCLEIKQVSRITADHIQAADKSI